MRQSEITCRFRVPAPNLWTVHAPFRGNFKVYNSKKAEKTAVLYCSLTYKVEELAYKISPVSAAFVLGEEDFGL